MRNIFKDVTLTIDGSSQNFRLTKPDAFSGVESFFSEWRVKSGEWSYMRIITKDIIQDLIFPQNENRTRAKEERGVDPA